MISPELRSQFERHGADLLSQVVAAGEHSSKGEELNKLLQYNRPAMIEWIQEQKAASDLLETKRFKTIRRWTVTAGLAGVIAAVAAIIAAWLTVWPRHEPEPAFRQTRLYDACLAGGGSIISCDVAMRIITTDREKARKEREEACFAAAKNDANRNPFDCFDPDKVGALPSSQGQQQ